MRVYVKDLYVGAFIRADFLCSYRDDAWHEVYDINIEGNMVYLAVEGYKGIRLPFNYEVELKI